MVTYTHLFTLFFIRVIQYISNTNYLLEFIYNYLYIKLLVLNSTNNYLSTKSKQTRRISSQSPQEGGTKKLMTICEVDINAILAEPMKNKTEKDLIIN